MILTVANRDKVQRGESWKRLRHLSGPHESRYIPARPYIARIPYQPNSRERDGSRARDCIYLINTMGSSPG